MLFSIIATLQALLSLSQECFFHRRRYSNWQSPLLLSLDHRVRISDSEFLGDSPWTWEFHRPKLRISPSLPCKNLRIRISGRLPTDLGIPPVETENITESSGHEFHPVSITRFPLRRLSPGAGLLRNPFVHRWWRNFFQGLGPKRRESSNGDRV